MSSKANHLFQPQRTAEQELPLTVAVQGFGNFGSGIVNLLTKDPNYRVIAVSDSKGGILIEKGIEDAQKIVEHKRSTRSVINFEGSKNISNKELLELDVDVLIPAALENQITRENAEEIKTKVILELANGPTTPDTDGSLKKKGVELVPDILANAGGVTVSYFEWVQNNQGYYWKDKEVEEKLREKMTGATKEVWYTKLELSVDTRMGDHPNPFSTIFLKKKKKRKTSLNLFNVWCTHE